MLDEADKLFEMGFVEQIDAAVGACTHPEVQRCLFSATLPETVEELARSVIPAPLRITVRLAAFRRLAPPPHAQKKERPRAVAP